METLVFFIWSGGLFSVFCQPDSEASLVTEVHEVHIVRKNVFF